MSGFYSIRTSSPDMWAYQIFPAGTPYSITNPQDSIGNYNDMQLTSFGTTTDMLERNSVAMMNNFERLYQQYQAQIAQWAQNTYPNISGNTNFNLPGMTPGVTPGRYSSLIEDDQVAGYISRLENDPLYGPELKKTITLENGDNVTYLKRLDDLIKDYLTTKPAALSDDDFAKIKEIAGKIAKTGKITKEDFFTLKEIVEKNKGELGTEKADRVKQEEAQRREEEEAKRKEDNAAAPVEKPYGYQQAAQDTATIETAAQKYYDGMHRSGTSCDTMNEGRRVTTKYNVIEIIDKFQDLSSEDNGLSLIEYIMDDFDNYGTGRSHWWLTDDDAKPYVSKLTECLKARGTDLINLKNKNGDKKLSPDTQNAISGAVTNLEKHLSDLYNKCKDSTDMEQEDKDKLVELFNAVVEAIKAAEIEAYGPGHNEVAYQPAAQPAPAAQA